MEYSSLPANEPSTMSAPCRVGAIVVLYQPDVAVLHQCIASLVQQVEQVCVVDNSEADQSSLFSTYGQKVHYLPNGCNIGIAAAQNAGIRYFRQRGVDYVLFSDQDSTSPVGLVRRLVDACISLSATMPVACVGPMPVNRKTGHPYLCTANICAEGVVSGIRYYIMHSIISSYSLVPVSVFDKVKGMDEGLFIDFVDDDWCWRAARQYGYRSFLLPDVHIAHEQGVSSSFLGHHISVSSPFRIYYQTRNLLWMCRRPYTPSYWKRMNLQKLFFKFVYYSLFTHHRMAYMRRMFKGLCDGIFPHCAD